MGTESHRGWTSLIAMTMRGLGLVARFGLVMYMAKYMTLNDVGAFGLVAGVVAMTPAVLGWGVNYFLGRDIVDQPALSAGAMIRDRLSLSILSLVAAAFVVLLTTAIGLLHLPNHALLIGLIVLLDSLAFDVHMAMIGQRQFLAANVMLFLRSSAWAFPVIGLGLIYPSLRTFEFVLWMWLAGLLAGYGLMMWRLRRAPVSGIVAIPIDWARLSTWLKRAPLIYINDIGIVGSLYLDRYVVNHFQGLELAGVFTLFWSVANGLHVLVYTGFIQLALPRLVTAAGVDLQKWRQLVRTEVTKVAVVSSVLGAVLFAAAVVGLPLVGMSGLVGHTTLFAVMLAATIVRLISDLLSYGLYSRSLDRQLALINLAAIVVTLAASVAGSVTFGLMGAGTGMLMSVLIVFVLRAAVLRRHWDQNPSDGTDQPRVPVKA